MRHVPYYTGPANDYLYELWCAAPGGGGGDGGGGCREGVVCAFVCGGVVGDAIVELPGSILTVCQ
jgi:hypothetical protein